MLARYTAIALHVQFMLLSGTTWTQQIVKLIWNQGEEDGRKVVNALPWLDSVKRIPTTSISQK